MCERTSHRAWHGVGERERESRAVRVIERGDARRECEEESEGEREGERERKRESERIE